MSRSPSVKSYICIIITNPKLQNQENRNNPFNLFPNLPSQSLPGASSNSRTTLS